MKLFIKHMVCPRCIYVVESLLDKLNLAYSEVSLGQVTLKQDISIHQKESLEQELEKLGFELIDDKRERLVESVKTLLVKLIYEEDNNLKVNLSDYLSDELNMDYTYISNQFSEILGTTIEKYFIAQKIERVKELLTYDELNLSEIAFRLNYSSVAHLSSQFKRITGITPSEFRQAKSIGRRPIDQV